MIGLPVWAFFILHLGAAAISYDLMKKADNFGWRIFWTFFLIVNVFYIVVTLYQLVEGHG